MLRCVFLLRILSVSKLFCRTSLVGAGMERQGRLGWWRVPLGRGLSELENVGRRLSASGDVAVVDHHQSNLWKRILWPCPRLMTAAL